MSMGKDFGPGQPNYPTSQWRKELSHLSLLNPSVTLWEQDSELRYLWVLNPQLPEREMLAVGKRDLDLIPDREEAERLEALKRSVLESGVGRQEEITIFSRGKRRYYNLVIEPIVDEDGRITGIRGASADITARKEALAALECSIQMTRLQHEAARYLGETLDTEQVYDRFHELLTAVVPHDGLVVSAYDPESGIIRCDYAWTDGVRLDPGSLPALPLNPQGEGMQSRVIRSGESLLINDVVDRVQNEEGTFYHVDGEGNLQKIPEGGEPEVQAAIMTPIKFQGQVLGVVQVMSDHTTYTEEQLEVVEAIVAQMSAAARNAKLYQAAQQEIAERRKVEQALRESEERFRGFTNSIPAVVWTAAPDGTITYANDQWFAYCGLTPEENARSWPEMVLHPDDYERCLAKWTRALLEGGDYQIEVRNRRYDGEYRWFLTQAVSLRDAKGKITAWYGTTTDIHDRKQAEQNLQFLFDLGTRMRMTDDPDELIGAAVEMMSNYLGLSRCYFGKVEPELDQLTIIRDYHPNLPPLSPTYHLSSFNPELFERLKTGLSLVTRDTRLDPLTAARYDGYYGPMGIVSRVSVPLVREGKLAGILWASRDRPHTWSRQEISLIETAAARAWLAYEKAQTEVERAKLLVELEHERAQLKKLNENLEQQVQMRTAQVRHLASALTLMEQQERRQLARELHDSAGQLLTALQIYIKLIVQEIPEELETVRGKMEEAVKMVQEAQQEVRAVSHAMRPAALDQLGLRVALEELSHDFARRTGIAVNYQSSELPHLDDHTSLSFYRFLQEALNNTAKHSQAKTVEVDLKHQDGELTLIVADDGVGFDVQEALASKSSVRGMGLQSLQERFYLLGGRVEINSQPGQGAKLVAWRNLSEERATGQQGRF